MLSKQDSISDFNTYSQSGFLDKYSVSFDTALLTLRPFRKPYECSSACNSTIGSIANL